MLWEHDPKASVSTAFSSSHRLLYLLYDIDFTWKKTEFIG